MVRRGNSVASEQIANPSDIAETHQGFNGIIPYVIIAVALGLFVYARSMRVRNVLS